ncbi:MAG: chromosome segregation protein SMC, partial [Alphaproteobacteria bacterium]|nr:chromosome segregation protein SMC [Alphaproteobacteria bacterium]
NLRAEEEAAEHEQRHASLTADRADLDGAIERLRRGIQSLNREGRERLRESFEKVNANFQTLFTKLFQGGEAKLTFTESEDPLEAGLEIYARPPGKRLQALSLLSGGEQALTATRFLVITHHALTMSRMNRLFGVTMAERGVSQLVSVTLQEAEQVIAAE